MAATEEYIFMAVPDESPTEDTLKYINEKTSTMSANCILPLPDLKIGSLDSLVSTAEQLSKADTYAASVVQKMMEFLQNLLGPDDHEHLLVGPSRVPMETFVQHFQWDVARYPLRLQLTSLIEVINKFIAQADTTFKQKAVAHNTVVQKLQAAEKRVMGNLLTRSLEELVSADKFVLDSEYLVTLLVVVPRLSTKEWLGSYESLTDMVVPRSTELIADDSEYCLYTVTLFKKVVEEFKLKAREQKFVVREFKFTMEGKDQTIHERRQLELQLKNQLGPMIHWLKVNFNVTFSAWIHLKCLRVLVESIMRYGLSCKLLAIVMKPHTKSSKLKSTLDTMFAHLDLSFVAKEINEEISVPGQHIDSEYHPFVMFTANIVPSPKPPSQPRRGSKQLQQTVDAVVGLDGGTCVRMPGQVAGRSFVVQKCRGSTILILDWACRVTIQECTNCRILVAACKERVLLDDCVDCQCFVATRQLVARWCVQCSLHLLCPTQPLLRSSVDILLGCLQFSYPQLKGHLDAAGLTTFTNMWCYVIDISKKEDDDDKSTWSLQPPGTTASLDLPGRNVLGDMTISFSKESSLIPHTTGPQENPPGESCVVVFFCQTENVRQKASQFLRQLKAQTAGSPPILLVQTMESTFKPGEAQWLSHHRLFNPQVTCMVAEVCGEGSAVKCRSIAAGLGVEALISSSVTDLEGFKQCVAIKLSMFAKQQQSVGTAHDRQDTESMLSQPFNYN